MKKFILLVITTLVIVSSSCFASEKFSVLEEAKKDRSYTPNGFRICIVKDNELDVEYIVVEGIYGVSITPRIRPNHSKKGLE